MERVQQIRTTQISTRLIDQDFRNSQFGVPQSRRDAWQNPGNVELCSLRWAYPWIDPAGSPLEPDRKVWARWMGIRQITDESRPQFLAELLRHAIPLRAHLPLSSPSQDGDVSCFAEVFLQPWGAAVALTATHRFDRPLPLPTVALLIDQFWTGEEVAVTMQEKTFRGSPDAIAPQLSDSVASSMGADGLQRDVSDDVRVSTVIDADTNASGEDLIKQDAFVASMHRLAGAADAGVPLAWLRSAGPANLGCSTSELRVPLGTGLAQWSTRALQEVHKDAIFQTGGIHRTGVAHSSMTALLYALAASEWQQPGPDWFGNLRTTYSDLLRERYEPTPARSDWIVQAHLDQRALGAAINAPAPKISWQCT